MSRCAGEDCTYPGCHGPAVQPDRYLDAGVVRDRLLGVPVVKWDLMPRRERRAWAKKGYYRAG